MININIGEILTLDPRTERPYNTASRVHYLKLNNLFTASGVVLIMQCAPLIVMSSAP